MNPKRQEYGSTVKAPVSVCNNKERARVLINEERKKK